MFPDLAHVHLEPPVAPLHDEVGVDLDREVPIVNLQDLKVVQPNLDLVQERVLGKLVESQLLPEFVTNHL